MNDPRAGYSKHRHDGRRRHRMSLLGGIVPALLAVAVLGSGRSFASGTAAGATSTQPSSQAATAAPPTIPGVPGGITPGAAFENKFVSMTSDAQQSVMSQMVNDHVQWLRLDVPADYRFSVLVRDATANGIHVDAILQAWTTALTPSAFSSFATQAVRTLKPLGVETYEVLNEPNCDQYCLSASKYTKILMATYRAIKSADPAATVLTAGMGPNSGHNEPYNYLTDMYNAGARGYFDAFNIHPYSYPDTPLQTGDGWNPWSYLPQLHTIMANHGDGAKQIWLTEFGCPTGTDGGYPAACTDPSLATQISDAFSMARGWTWTGPLLIYSWIDDPVGKDGDFGLYDASGNPKPATVSAYTLAASQ